MPPETLRTVRSLEPDGTELVEEELRGSPGWSPLVVDADGVGDTRYEVLDGRARVRIGASERVYRAGESVIAGPGQAVVLEPVDGEGIHLLVQRWLPG